MIGLEDGFRRFQDFGLILGLAIVITIIGSMLRFAFVVGQQQLPVMRVLFYLRYCIRRDSPVLGYARRSNRELVLGVLAVCFTTVLGGVFFELIC
jgi:hypothetical protein